MLNRGALILRCRQPFVDWINAVDPVADSPTLSLADVNSERTVYLVEVEDEPELEAWLTEHHQKLFEAELNGWYTDPSLWPNDRSLGTLRKWCSIELHSVVYDWGDTDLEVDD